MFNKFEPSSNFEIKMIAGYGKKLDEVATKKSGKPVWEIDYLRPFYKEQGFAKAGDMDDFYQRNKMLKGNKKVAKEKREKRKLIEESRHITHDGRSWKPATSKPHLIRRKKGNAKLLKLSPTELEQLDKETE